MTISFHALGLLGTLLASPSHAETGARVPDSAPKGDCGPVGRLLLDERARKGDDLRLFASVRGFDAFFREAQDEGRRQWVYYWMPLQRDGTRASEPQALSSWGWGRSAAATPDGKGFANLEAENRNAATHKEMGKWWLVLCDRADGRLSCRRGDEVPLFMSNHFVAQLAYDPQHHEWGGVVFGRNRWGSQQHRRLFRPVRSHGTLHPEERHRP